MYFSLSSLPLRNSRKNTQVHRFSTKYQISSGISNNCCLHQSTNKPPVLMELRSACIEKLGWVKRCYFFQNYFKKFSDSVYTTHTSLSTHQRGQQSHSSEWAELQGETLVSWWPFKLDWAMLDMQPILGSSDTSTAWLLPGIPAQRCRDTYSTHMYTRAILRLNFGYNAFFGMSS